MSLSICEIKEKLMKEYNIFHMEYFHGYSENGEPIVASRSLEAVVLDHIYFLVSGDAFCKDVLVNKMEKLSECNPKDITMNLRFQFISPEDGKIKIIKIDNCKVLSNEWNHGCDYEKLGILTVILKKGE